MKKRIAFTALCAAAFFVVVFAVLCYPGEFYITSPSGHKLLELDSNDITNYSDCTVLSDGTIKTDYSGDPYIDFSGLSTNARCIVINMEWIDNGSDMLLYYHDGAQMVENDFVMVHPNAIIDGNVYVEIPESNYQSIRLKAKGSYILNGIQLYEESVNERLNTPVSAKRYIFTIVATIFIAFAVYFIDWNFNISGRIFNYVKSRRKKLCIFAGAGTGIFAFAAAAEFFIYRVINSDPEQMFFHNERFVFIFALLFIAFVFVFFARFKQLSHKPEKAMLCIILCLGLALIIGSPAGQRSWDVDRHYEWAHNASYYGTAYVSRADKLVYDMSWVSWPTFNRSQNQEHIQMLNSFDKMYLGTADADTLLPHRISGIFIAVGRLFGASFYQKFLLGEFAVLLVYALLCYLSARKLKSGKMIIAVIALLPTNLFMASNFSYDCWVIGFIMLGMSYFIAQLQDSDKGFSFKDTIIMCLSFMLACLPKLVYLTVMVIPFFLRKKTFTKKDYKRYYTICGLFTVGLCVMLALRSVWSISSGGDTRGGDVNSMEQVRFILSDILGYAKILINFLLKYLSIGQAHEYITKFAHVGWGTLAPVFIALLIFTAFTDKAECDRFRGKNNLRLAAIVFFIGTAALMATAFYISFTVPGSSTIVGCQARYITPLLFPLLILIANPGILKLANKHYYNFAVLAVASCAVLYNVYTSAVCGYY